MTACLHVSLHRSGLWSIRVLTFAAVDSNNATPTYTAQRTDVARDLLRADLIMMMHYLDDIARMERSSTSIWSIILCIL
jgi:hypothetical protein